MRLLNKNKPVQGAATIEIDKPVRQVFSFVAEHFFENYPRWALEVVEFKPINNNPMQVGALAKQVRYDQGHKVESVFEIEKYEQDKLLVCQGLSHPFRHSYLFDQLTDEKTLLTDRFELLELELFMRPFEKLIRVAIEEGLQNSLDNIKKLLG
ncbi:SRPBCC family protein [Methylomarinum vadi]|uniref:SRPBCC family protein n=1 Tax=Methylomarinum vadi TaxID=438855 RepID=UPI0004DF6FEB|nr:SRPBCC family protein [Methylomarinum vadi]